MTWGGQKVSGGGGAWVFLLLGGVRGESAELPWARLSDQQGLQHSTKAICEPTMGNLSLTLSGAKVLPHSLFLLMIRKTKEEKFFHRDWGTERMGMSPSSKRAERMLETGEGLKEPVSLTKSAKKSGAVDGVLGEGWALEPNRQPQLPTAATTASWHQGLV